MLEGAKNKVKYSSTRRKTETVYPQGDPNQPDYSNVLAIAAITVALGSILYLILR